MIERLSKNSTVSVSALTGVRWHTLQSGARRSAVRTQMRGGGTQNPHSTLLALSKGYLTRRHTKRETLKLARRVRDKVKRHYVRHCLKNLIRTYPVVSIDNYCPKTIAHRKGPKGLVELKIKPDVFISMPMPTYVGFWPNQSTQLTQEAARLHAQLVRESVDTSAFPYCAFHVVDLYHGRKFSFDVEDLDEDDSDLREFLKNLEEIIESLRR